MTSKTYGPLEINESNEYDIESLQETKETKEKEPIVRGKFMVRDKFKVIDDLDKEHLRKIEIKRIKIQLFTILIIILVTALGVWVYKDEMLEDDKFKEYQKPNMYNADIMEGMSARIMGHHQRRRQCGDYKYGCCEIYYGPDKNDKYTISPYRDIKQDETGSNCPFLKDLVDQFNINYKDEYSEGGTMGYCEIDTTFDSSAKNISGGKMYLVQPKDDSIGYNCYHVRDLVHMYEYHWVKDDTLGTLLMFSFIIGIICCTMSRK